MTTDVRDPDPEPVVADAAAHSAKAPAPVPELHEAASRGNLALVQSLLELPEHSVDERDASGATLLMVAARDGQLPVVELLVQRGADVTLKNKNQSTALMFAALHGRAAIAAFLLAQPAAVERINDMNVGCYSALHCATSEGHLEVVQLLLDHGADAEVTNDGWRPLHVACSKNYVAIIKLLLKHGVDVNAPMQDGITALHFVALHGSIELATLLLDAGAGIAIGAGESHMTPLHLAAVRGDVAMIQFLLDHGAQVDTETTARATPFYTAAEHGHLEAAKLFASIDAQWKTHKSPIHVVAANGFADVLAFLLESGVDIELPDDHGLTPLCVAAVRDQVETVNALIAAGANVNAKTAEADGYSCLHYCAELGRVEIMAILIAHGADIHARTAMGHSPFNVATIHGHVPVLSLLLEHGADPLADGAGHFFAPHLAATTGRLAVLEYLATNGFTRDFEHETSGVTPMSLAAAAGHLNVVAFLMEFQDTSGAPDAAKTARRTEALIGAIEGEHLDIVKYLCERGGAGIEMLETKDTTALHTAAAIGNVPIVEYLLTTQHASVRARNAAGLTPLLYAATAGHAHVVDVLLAHGASVDEVVEHSCEPELDGTASIHFAALYAHMNVLETLVAHGANINAKTSQGTGVLDCARDCDDEAAIPHVVAFLEAHGAVAK